MKIQWTGRVLGTPSGKWQPPRKTETYNTPDQPGTDDPGVRQPRKSVWVPTRRWPIAGTRWRTKRYMNMNCLREMQNEMLAEAGYSDKICDTPMGMSRIWTMTREDL